MPVLTRSVRFCVNPPAKDAAPLPGSPDNTFAGFPSMRGLGRFYELVVRCRGEVDATTGYFLNIKVIDRAVREWAVPVIERACHERPETDPAEVLRELLPGLSRGLGGVVESVRWNLSPYYSVEVSPMPAAPSVPVVLIRQQFDFAAAHRLHAPALSDAENRSVFGKCNNPSGHGHNYRVEPCVAVRLDRPEPRFSLADVERLTARTLIDRFDHTHLNEDTREFAVGSPGGLNPSVENIAKVFFDLLAPAVASASAGSAELRSITVWETDKTSCTYPG